MRSLCRGSTEADADMKVTTEAFLCAHAPYHRMCPKSHVALDALGESRSSFLT